MKNPELNVGVIVPPNKHYKPVLYSDSEAGRQFKQMDRDIYMNQKKYSFEDTKKAPKLITWGAVIAALSAAGLFIFSKFKK